MVGGRLRSLSRFPAYAVVLLFGVSLHDGEASSCERIIHKKVGDTVEFSTCLPSEGVTSSGWKYKTVTSAGRYLDITTHHQFKGRADINPQNFSLTIRELSLQDSGEFQFVSEVEDKQRDTVIIILQVHEPIPEKPVLTSINNTWEASDQSCTALLECSATSDTVSYSWTVGNRTQTGRRLRYTFMEQDGETTFTCTVSNVVSQKSAFTTMTCSNNTQETGTENFILVLSVAGGCCLLVVIIVGIAVCVCQCKQREAGSDSNELTVYADIADVAVEGGSSSTMKASSVYETINNRVHTVTPGPQTVYDKIQLNRVRKASVSPYQEVV